MNIPKRIDITEEELKALLARAKKLLPEEDYEIIKGMADTIVFLSKAVGTKNAQVQKLLRLLFGTFDEKTQKVLKEKKERKALAKDTGGHGRNGADSYSGADTIQVPHVILKEKEACPTCGKGKLYILEPASIVRVTGNAPLAAKVYELDRLRCNLCGQVFTATAPEGIGEEKYDSAAGAIIALLKYGAGLPFYRLKALQDSLGIPLPASTQWDIVGHVAASIDPVYRQLVRRAAQGEILYNDDTIAKILSRINIADDKSNKRKGIFTSGILSVAGSVKIALFFTGHNHAGENLAGVLEKRNAALGPPIQMCDGLSRNIPKEFKTIVSNCIVHARRRFVEINESFPNECKFVLKTLEKVYKNDAYTKDKNMSPEDRLKYHQKKSAKLMKDLKLWLAAQLDEKNIEPNSALGGAISYMLKHYKAMTLFLREPKAPLDNNLCLSSGIYNPQDFQKSPVIGSVSG